MKLIKLGLITTFALTVPLALAQTAEACPPKSDGTSSNHHGIKKLEVSELAKILADTTKSATVTVYDANSDETRAKHGIIPGAKLLSNYGEYNVEKELPAQKDAKIVFYCGSTHCGSAEKAADRAVEAGYIRVAVLPAGIKGWKEAGHETASVADKGES